MEGGRKQGGFVNIQLHCIYMEVRQLKAVVKTTFGVGYNL